MKLILAMDAPENDEFGKLVAAYTDAKRALEEYLYRERLTLTPESEEAVSGN